MIIKDLLNYIIDTQIIEEDIFNSDHRMVITKIDSKNQMLRQTSFKKVSLQHPDIKDKIKWKKDFPYNLNVQLDKISSNKPTQSLALNLNQIFEKAFNETFSIKEITIY